MRFDALKKRAAFQATGDADEAAELEPHVSQYVNEGYERLLKLTGREGAQPLSLDAEEPDLPAWAHPALADYAAWMLLRNGNPQRQARGIQFRAAFEETAARMLRDGGLQGKRTKFVGIYP